MLKAGMLECCSTSFGDPLGVDSTCLHPPSMPWPAALKSFSWAKAGRKFLGRKWPVVVLVYVAQVLLSKSYPYMRFQCLAILVHFPCGFCAKSVRCMHHVMCDRIFSHLSMFMSFCDCTVLCM